jgi:hypothetical protein
MNTDEDEHDGYPKASLVELATIHRRLDTLREHIDGQMSVLHARITAVEGAVSQRGRYQPAVLVSLVGVGLAVVVQAGLLVSWGSTLSEQVKNLEGFQSTRWCR